MHFDLSGVPLQTTSQVFWEDCSDLYCTPSRSRGAGPWDHGTGDPKTNCNGLQLTSNGLQPKSDGLQPTCRSRSAASRKTSPLCFAASLCLLLARSPLLPLHGLPRQRRTHPSLDTKQKEQNMMNKKAQDPLNPTEIFVRPTWRTMRNQL